MAYQPGPKELALKALREQRAETTSKPSTSELRKQIAATKGGGKKKAKTTMKRRK